MNVNLQYLKFTKARMQDLQEGFVMKMIHSERFHFRRISWFSQKAIDR